MAKSRNNVVTHGLSGKIGDLLVFTQRYGKTIVGKIPEKSKNVSEKQMAQRKRFQQAIIYAKGAVKSPESGELYTETAKKKKGKTPINIAVADFFNAPDIVHVDLSGYAGNVGDIVGVEASDDFAVKSVRVEIINSDGETIEDGEAIHLGGLLWSYTAMCENENTDGCRIVITASDLPGNVAREELTVE